MSRRVGSAALVGWIRLLPDGDGYGVPLFRGPGNAPMTAETDDDLAIASFHEFYNEAGYAISHALPPDWPNRRYRLGDRIPIPLILRGEVEVVDGDATEESFLADHRDDAAAPAVAAVAGILRSAASGEFRARSAERVARRLRLEHDEVLGGDPAHSAYWVQKLGLLSSAIRRMPADEQDHGRQVVSERATAWLGKFDSKSEPGMLVGLLKAITDGRGAPAPAIRDAVFKAVLSRFMAASQSVRDGDNLLAAARPWLPEGLQGHFLNHGMPAGLSKRDQGRVRDLPRLVLDAIDEEDAENESFSRSLSLAKAIFAGGDLPLDLSEFVHRRARDRMEALEADVRRVWLDGGGRSSRRDLDPEEVRRLLRENDRVVTLYRILHGEDRLSYKPGKGPVRFGLPEADVALLRDASSPLGHQAAARPPKAGRARR